MRLPSFSPSGSIVTIDYKRVIKIKDYILFIMPTQGSSSLYANQTFQPADPRSEKLTNMLLSLGAKLYAFHPIGLLLNLSKYQTFNFFCVGYSII